MCSSIYSNILTAIVAFTQNIIHVLTTQIYRVILRPYYSFNIFYSREFLFHNFYIPLNDTKSMLWFLWKSSICVVEVWDKPHSKNNFLASMSQENSALWRCRKAMIRTEPCYDTQTSDIGPNSLETFFQYFFLVNIFLPVYYDVIWRCIFKDHHNKPKDTWLEFLVILLRMHL